MVGEGCAGADVLECNVAMMGRSIESMLVKGGVGGRWKGVEGVWWVVEHVALGLGGPEVLALLIEMGKDGCRRSG